MSEEKFKLNPELEHEIDLLVDGELDDTGRRDLLRRLDDEPQSWRSCALRFVESQCLREDLHEVVDHAARRRNTAAHISSARDHSKMRSRPSWQVVLSLAACLAMAFGIGLLSQDLLFPNQAESASDSQLAQSKPNAEPDDSAAANNGKRRGFPQTWVVGSEADLTPEMIDELERLGHRVERSQEFWPVGLGDGGVGLVPMERVDIHYVGDSYQ